MSITNHTSQLQKATSFLTNENQRTFLKIAAFFWMPNNHLLVTGTVSTLLPVFNLTVYTLCYNMQRLINSPFFF